MKIKEFNSTKNYKGTFNAYKKESLKVKNGVILIFNFKTEIKEDVAWKIQKILGEKPQFEICKIGKGKDGMAMALPPTPTSFSIVGLKNLHDAMTLLPRALGLFLRLKNGQQFFPLNLD